MTNPASRNEQPVSSLPVEVKHTMQASEIKAPVAENFAVAIGVPALVGSVLTAAAYLTGVAFQQAYLTSFQVNYGLFVKGSSDYFLFAFQAILELLPTWFRIFGENFGFLGAIFGLLLLCVLVNMGGEMLDRSSRLKKMRIRIQSSKLLAVLGQLFLLPTLGLAVIYYIPLFLALLLILPVELGSYSGRRAAQADMERFEKGCKPIKNSSAFCTQIMENGNGIAYGFVIETSDKYVALNKDVKARVLPIKESEFMPFNN